MDPQCTPPRLTTAYGTLASCSPGNHSVSHSITRARTRTSAPCIRSCKHGSSSTPTRPRYTQSGERGGRTTSRSRGKPVKFYRLSTTRRLLIVGVSVCLLAFGLLDGPRAAVRSADAQVTPTGDLRVAVRQVAASLRPAVVQITNEQVQVGHLNHPLVVPSGVASAVISDAQCHILPTNHVV